MCVGFGGEGDGCVCEGWKDKFVTLLIREHSFTVFGNFKCWVKYVTSYCCGHVEFAYVLIFFPKRLSSY